MKPISGSCKGLAPLARMVAVIAAAVFVPAAAQAQLAARVATTITEPGSTTPVSQVLPGQTVRIRTILTWTPNVQFAGLKGGIIGVGPGEGFISNVSSDYSPGALVSLGTPYGNSIMGLDLAQTPAFFTGGFLVPPSYNWNGLNVTSYDWTAPAEPGVYEFGFVASALAPNVRLFPSTNSANFVEARTTYVGSSVVVIPAPAALLLLGVVSGCRRNRP